MIGEETIEGYMPSIFIIKAKIENPTEWYDRKFANDIEWEEDEFLESYHAGWSCVKI